jgi:hypothetical protein
MPETIDAGKIAKNILGAVCIIFSLGIDLFAETGGGFIIDPNHQPLPIPCKQLPSCRPPHGSASSR